VTKLYKEKENMGRTHLDSRFMRESLVDKQLIESTKIDDTVSIIPDINVLSIGGKSIIDRGRKAVYPLLEEVVEINKNNRLLIGVSGGARESHTLAIGLDFGLPIGGLSKVAGAIEEQNATMLYALLAKHGAIRLHREHFMDLPNFLNNGMIPIMTSRPPHHYWEKPPRKGILPDNGADYGMYMTAEVLGAKSMIFIKDQDGLYSEDPQKNPKAEFIPKISASELLKSDPDDLIIDYNVIVMLNRAKHVKKILIINGLKKGELTKAINGEEVGTTIFNEGSE